MKVMLRDGLLYYRYVVLPLSVACVLSLVKYSVIFAINFVLTVMIAAAPPAIQNLTAQYVQFLLELARSDETFVDQDRIFVRILIM